MRVRDFLELHLRGSTQHVCFYHFTDRRNLPSIQKHGLLSMRRLRDLNISVPAPGGDESSQFSDRQKGTDKYVCLCFTDSHPMAYVAAQNRGLDLFYLRINPQVIMLPGVLMTNAASNQHGVVPRPVADMLDELDLEVLYKRTDWKDPVIQSRLKLAEKYEILVPTRVSLQYILNLHG